MKIGSPLREGVASFFREFGGVDGEACGFEVDGVLHHLAGGVGEAG